METSDINKHQQQIKKTSKVFENIKITSNKHQKNIRKHCSSCASGAPGPPRGEPTAPAPLAQLLRCFWMFCLCFVDVILMFLNTFDVLLMCFWYILLMFVDVWCFHLMFILMFDVSTWSFLYVFLMFCLCLFVFVLFVCLFVCLFWP